MLEQELQWQAPDFRKTGRRCAWQSLSLLFAFIIGIVAFLERSIPFFILVVAVEFVILFFTRTRRNRSDLELYSLTTQQLSISGEVVYRHGDILWYSVTDHDETNLVPWTELIVGSKNTWPRVRRILVPQKLGFSVGSYLGRAWGVPEEEYKMNILEFVMRVMGF